MKSALILPGCFLHVVRCKFDLENGDLQVVHIRLVQVCYLEGANLDR